MRGTRDWLGEALRNAFVLLRLGWEHGGRWARLAIRYAAVVIVGLPIAVTLTALTGIHALTGVVVFAAFFALGWVVWAITQPRYQDYLAGGLVAGGGIATIDKLGDVRQTVASGLRGLRIILLVETGVGAYFFFVPVENNRGLVLGIPILATLMLLSLGLSRGWRLVFFWIPLIALIVLTVNFFSEEKWFRDLGDKAKAAPVETRQECERRGGVVKCLLTLPVDGSKSEGIYASDFEGKTNWEATGPSGTLVCPDENSCVPLREGAEALEVLRFVREGGGEVTVTFTDSD